MDEQTVAKAIEDRAARTRATLAATRAANQATEREATERQQQDAETWQTDPAGSLRRAVADQLGGRGGAVRTLRGERGTDTNQPTKETS